MWLIVTSIGLPEIGLPHEPLAAHEHMGRAVGVHIAQLDEDMHRRPARPDGNPCGNRPGKVDWLRDRLTGKGEHVAAPLDLALVRPLEQERERVGHSRGHQIRGVVHPAGNSRAHRRRAHEGATISARGGALRSAEIQPQLVSSGSGHVDDLCHSS